MALKPDIELVALTKRYGDTLAVDSIDLRIPAGSYCCLLGPSGCGKTTTLRMIAGHEEASDGDILLGSENITHLPTAARGTAMMFQSYALFPHLDCTDNVAFSLKMRGVDKETRRGRALDMLKRVQMDPYASRLPAQLSGGQQQRVALARALVNRPAALLLDEPLGALDLKLRKEMQHELKSLQAATGITFVYITHDQEEALTMSDRLAVFNAGRIEQIGTPAEVYERPATGFVAGFVGVSNVLEGEIARRIAGDARPFTVRPEKIALAEPAAPVPAGACSAEGHVAEVVYLGAVTRYIVELDGGGSLVVMQQNLATSSMEALQVRGKSVRLVWDPSNNRPVEASAG